MDVTAIMDSLDRLYNENKPKEAEELLIGAISVAAEEQDGYGLLQLMNELLGLYRETSQVEASFALAKQAIDIASSVVPRESVPFATTLLNVATVYRAGGDLESSLRCYKEVEEIYGAILSPDNMLVASLYNNESLLYQELGDFSASKSMLLKALEIVRQKGERYEEAVSLANLAGSCMQLGELEEGADYAQKAMLIFDELSVHDGHYAASLSAMGSFYYIKGDFKQAAKVYRNAMDIMERSLGKNAFYERLKENYELCLKESKKQTKAIKGLALSAAFYKELGAKMIHDLFPEYESKIAVGLVGEGSDCYGYDDSFSADHDWGPSFCMWVTDEVYEEIGEKLQQAYDSLPEEFEGYKIIGKKKDGGLGSFRRGVQRISAFYTYFVGTDIYENIDWKSVEDYSLAAATNGEVFRDDEGIFTAFRKQLQAGYPDTVLYLKIAQAAAAFAQSIQYNYSRMHKRGDTVTANMMKMEGLKQAMKLVYYGQNAFPTHDKWLYLGLTDLEGGAHFCDLISEINGFVGEEQEEITVAKKIEVLSGELAYYLYSRNWISDVDSYLDHHTEELVEKSIYSNMSTEELAMEIAKKEFEAFDQVQNEGGRASCQNDWPTFSIMRRSQYLTWTRPMLLQYLYDFHREMKQGHNLITEKYGRMMESTAPDQYLELKEHFPQLTEEQIAIINQVAAVQVGWMEAFSGEYPKLAQNARSIHTYEDNPFNTSYETYLRGELGTYSDKMLQLYAGFIVSLARENRNLAYETMENSCRLYGYKSLEQAEAFMNL